MDLGGEKAQLLVEAHVAGIDVAGAGGTSWAKVESVRASNAGLSDLGAALGEWGIPTVDSLLAVREAASAGIALRFIYGKWCSHRFAPARAPPAIIIVAPSKLPITCVLSISR